MKKIIHLSSIIFIFAFPGIVLADDSLDSQDFRYLVCSYIEDSSSIENAFTKIDAVAEKLDIDDSQEEILQSLWDGDLMSDEYCSGLEF